MATKQELIQELKEEHKKQRGFQRLVNDETLNYELLESMSIEQLEDALKSVRKERESK